MANKLGIRPLRDKIIFRFEDEVVVRNSDGVRRTQFAETTDWGFVIADYTKDAIDASRWGIVEAVGNEVSDNVKIGDKILIEPLKWTTHFEIDDNKYWQTTEEHVLAIYKE